MNVSSRFRFRIVLPVLFLLALPGDARAGFQWIGFWDVETQGRGGGYASFRSTGFEQPDGVDRVAGSISGRLQFTQPSGSPFYVHPPYDYVSSASIVLSRHFRLSGSPGGWEVDLDWFVDDSSQFTIHVNYSGPYSTMGVSSMRNHQEPIRMLSYTSGSTIFLPDGDYLFTVGASGSLSFAYPPSGPWGSFGPFTVYYGQFRYEFAASLKATAVPEPAPWLMIGQGTLAAAGLSYLSKRRNRGSI